MKSYIYFLLLFFLFSVLVYSQRYDVEISNDYPKFYIGIGFGLQSYIGGDFGKTYSLRFSGNDNYYDDYNGYYNSYNYGYRDYENDLISPIGFDVAAGIELNSYLSIELESSFIWHLFGRPDRQYETGFLGNEYYIDCWDDSRLYANPIFLGAKIYPFKRERIPLYLSAAFGWQYTKEAMDRVREYYDYNYYYNYYYPKYIIGSYSDSKWMTGFKTGIGASYAIFDLVITDIELRYTNFYPQKDLSSPLTMNRVPNIGNLALITKFSITF